MWFMHDYTHGEIFDETSHAWKTHKKSLYKHFSTCIRIFAPVLLLLLGGHCSSERRQNRWLTANGRSVKDPQKTADGIPPQICGLYSVRTPLFCVLSITLPLKDTLASQPLTKRIPINLDNKGLGGMFHWYLGETSSYYLSNMTHSVGQTPSVATPRICSLVVSDVEDVLFSFKKASTSPFVSHHFEWWFLETSYRGKLRGLMSFFEKIPHVLVSSFKLSM